ncbi:MULTISPECIES: cation diffusion facilitator family transporter [unclassified Pseudofrankia]|uniref:cation diffusion facilitator family transporter n=1 Tax=unclassified Pseudofrankia TaxID=2994372 RepID=UPI0008DA99C4|nr:MULTISPECIES: cation diffusion facilitator family transporter [unclassified Pseudofrankia]MDT3442599.1 cation diffusion facilitator family transporter [Pseudofrankia sp. BMG5.37]OHV71751.1 cation diffusion facilitator family transporter [Pseudofrankia sp. BMG5.36]
MSDPTTTREPPGHNHGHGRGGGHRHEHAGHGEHGHDHGEHRHGHGHDQEPGPGRWARLRHRAAHVVTPHSHEASDKVDPAMEASADGMRTLWISLAVLGVTTVLQALVVVLSGSVALLGDTIHNGADALTAVPLGIALVLGRRAATRRFTYGLGRAEDLAGIAIVLTITASSALAAYTAIDRLLDPRDVGYLPAVAAAAVTGFVGNEWVARYRIRTGRRIGSAALVADGLHARTDGFTSLAVLLGAGGAALGWRLADPIVGLLITVAILAVLKEAAKEVFRRLMDAVDPALVDTAETALRQVPGVVGVGEVRMRWIGHQLRAEATVVVDGSLSLWSAHQVAVDAEHALLHAVPRLTAALIHPDPTRTGGEDPHAALAHHQAA